MTWWDGNWRAAAVGGALLLVAAAACLLGWVAARRRERRMARWRRDHARRLPWALFVRRRVPLRLVDGRAARTGSGPERPSA